MPQASVSKRKYHAVPEKELYQKLEERGFSIFSWNDGPGAVYNPHSHDHDEVIVVFEGEMIFAIDGIEHVLEPGDELNLPAHTVHSAVNRGDRAVRYYICSPN